MNKADFLEQLSQKLRERGVEEEMVVRQTAKFERYLDDSDIESSEFEKEFDELDSIADEISILLKTRKSKEQDLQSQNDMSDTNDANDAHTVHIAAAGVAELAPDRAAQDRAVQNKAAQNQTTTVPAISNVETNQEKGVFGAIKELFFPLKKSSLKKEEMTEQQRAGNRLFWILFFLSLPISLPALCLGLSLFAAAYLALALLIVMLLGALVTAAAGGTALSLIGIIYGGTQILRSLPIGMYEIGLGVTIGGGAMFLGIAMYNIALRLLPYIIKKLTVFFIFALKQLKKLFILAKGACVRI